MAQPQNRHPAPPYYRNSRPGKAVPRHTGRVRPTTSGAYRPNMSIPPLVHTNGVGERVQFELRSGKMNAPRLTID